MAGQGFAPKDPEKRSGTNKPRRGEWVTLPGDRYAGKRPALPRLVGGLLASSKKAWEWWWRSPMAHMWTEAEWPMLQRLIALHDGAQRQMNDRDLKGVASLLSEARQLEDRLGISEKGRRDLRWKLPDADGEPELAVVQSIGSRAQGDPRRR